MLADEYQKEAHSTAVYPSQHSLLYIACGLAGEVGEVCNIAKKVIRNDNGVLTQEKKLKLFDELGDVSWYLAELCTELGLSLSEVFEYNLQKLAKRKEENTLKERDGKNENQS